MTPMKRKDKSKVYPKTSSLIFALIMSSILIRAISMAESTINHYDAIGMIGYNQGTEISIVDTPSSRIVVTVQPTALNRYMDERHIHDLELTVEVQEKLVQCHGDFRYRLDFTFGPSGAYFNPPLELKLEGKYAQTACPVWLFDEEGEALEGIRDPESDGITFHIPHFSRYSYDEYDHISKPKKDN